MCARLPRLPLTAYPRSLPCTPAQVVVVVEDANGASARASTTVAVAAPVDVEAVVSDSLAVVELAVDDGASSEEVLQGVG